MDGRGRHILVVDDDPMNARLMQEICEAAGYQVGLAGDGREAIELCRSQPPDLLLLDLRVGDKDGFQVCRELRADPTTAGISIILVTAVDDLESKIRGIELGADDYVTKPFRMFDLQARIRSVLDADEAQEGPAAQASQRVVSGYRALRRELEHELQRSQRYKHPLSILLLVLDGHAALAAEMRRREAAAQVAALVDVLHRELRSVDRIYRLATDAFLVLLPETQAAAVAVPQGRILAALASHPVSHEGPVGLSCALVSYPDERFATLQAMLEHLSEVLRTMRRQAPGED